VQRDFVQLVRQAARERALQIRSSRSRSTWVTDPVLVLPSTGPARWRVPRCSVPLLQPAISSFFLFARASPSATRSMSASRASANIPPRCSSSLT
jgi:hypothetical protein